MLQLLRYALLCFWKTDKNEIRSERTSIGEADEAKI